MKDLSLIDTILVEKDSLKQFVIESSASVIYFEGYNNSLLSTNIITISIALIAGFIALMQVKSNNISKARIEWIENLRNALSEYIVEVSKLAIYKQNVYEKCLKLKDNEQDEFLETSYKEFIKLSNKADLLANKVFLYLNSDEEEHKKIELLLKKFSKNLYEVDQSHFDFKEFKFDKDEVILLSKDIFKKEWSKSKSLFKI